MPTAAYLHIPFCRRRCFYCDFPIAVLGDRKRGETSQAMDVYVNWLCTEIQTLPSDLFPPLQTIFLGGGTPSLLSSQQLAQVLATVRHQFGWVDAAEISMEMDPGTFDGVQLDAFVQLGINRVSLGVQSFQDSLLATCGRFHRRSQIERAIADLQRVGIVNWSLDLISGLPGQTLKDWQRDIECAIAIHPPHLSVYDLVLEPTTVFGKRYQAGYSPLPTDETAAQMYRMASEQLRAAGYDHYEVSNYAQPGYRCRHNQVYWHNQPYYGFGMGATSYLQGQRVSRPRTRSTYYEWVKQLIAAQGQLDGPVDTHEDQLLETLMLGLRLTTGIAWAKLAAQFGPQIIEPMLTALIPHIKAGYVDVGQPEQLQGSLRLTDPEGLLFSNTVIVDLWQALAPEEPTPCQAIPKE